jgi:hypothetical protein
MWVAVGEHAKKVWRTGYSDFLHCFPFLLVRL